MKSISKLLEIKSNKKGDNRKMVFVFKYKQDCPSTLKKPIEDNKDVENLLAEIDVIGVAIGSSNFSFNTYGGCPIPLPSLFSSKPKFKKNNKADKGEADILMFKDEQFKDKIMQQMGSNTNSNSSLVISKSLTEVSDEFFKEMLKSTFDYSL